jgi:hypothetical protein
VLKKIVDEGDEFADTSGWRFASASLRPHFDAWDRMAGKRNSRIVLTGSGQPSTMFRTCEQFGLRDPVQVDVCLDHPTGLLRTRIVPVVALASKLPTPRRAMDIFVDEMVSYMVSGDSGRGFADSVRKVIFFVGTPSEAWDFKLMIGDHYANWFPGGSFTYTGVENRKDPVAASDRSLSSFRFSCRAVELSTCFAAATGGFEARSIFLARFRVFS